MRILLYPVFVSLLLHSVAVAACLTNPMMQGQDPSVVLKDGIYHLVQSDGCRIHLKRSPTLGGLATASSSVIWNVGCSEVWAPELHWISNRWYLYISRNPGSGHRGYVAESTGTNPYGPYVSRGILDNSFWNIDANVFTWNGQLYYICSGNPSGSQNIYIAPMSNPYTLSGPLSLLSQPTAAWETIGNPDVNEGPWAFQRDGRLFIVYSASGCWTDDYTLGLLELTGPNILDRASWTKTGPVFTRKTGAYGPGHNCVVQDTAGQWWNLYHANNNPGEGCGGLRKIRAQRIWWNASGFPDFGSPVPIGSIVNEDPDFLVAHYSFNETAGTNAANAGCGPAATLNGGAAWAALGVQFNGTDSSADAGAALGNDVQHALTLSAWIRPDAFVDWAGIITKGVNSSPYAMQVWSDGSLRFSANWGGPAGGIGSGVWNSATKMATGQWYHAAITYDGERVRFYLNGVLDANQPQVALRFGVVDESLMFGADLPGGDEYFNGVIRDARVYGRACSEGEIRSMARWPEAVGVDPGYAVVEDFEGWGTSLCWWANLVGGYANRETYASLAFSTLKLNIVRYNIGGGENPSITNTMEYRARMEGFQPSEGVWNWSADANQRWMLRRAVELGADRVVAFANSPPWWMTVSGSVTGSADGTSNNLQTSYESAFAEYLATVVSNLTVLDGVEFDLVTPINEPQADWWKLGGRQEGCHTSPAQQARLVNLLRAALDAGGIEAGIDASEDSDQQSAINSINAYGSAQSNVTIIASHTYGANNPTGLRNLGVSLRKPVWISEYGDGDGTGMKMARRIRDDIADTWARAWIYWQVVDNAGGWGFLRNSLNATGDTSYTINKKFYVMGQFSQYIRPGARILGMGEPNSLAAYHPTNRTLVIVAVNDTTNSLPVAYNLTAFSSLPTHAVAVRTSATQNLGIIPPVPLLDKSFLSTLPALSVTTFILNNVAPSESGPQPQAWYPFEGTVLDASGNGFHGVSSGVNLVPGKLGAQAAQFNGSSSYVQIPLVVSNHFTIGLWLRTAETGGSGQWWTGKGLVDGEVNGANEDFGVSLVSGKAAVGVGTPDATIITSNTINDGQWHHIAATRDAVSGELCLYVDGLLQASGYGSVGPKGAPPALRIGSIQTGTSGGFLNGTIDEVKIFARVLPPAQIGLLMNNPPAITTVASDYTIMAGRTLWITNSASDLDLPAQSLTWSLLDPPAGAAIGADGVFSWRPAVSQAPSTNTITLQVADNGTPSFADTQAFTLSVLLPSAPELSSPHVEGSEFLFTASGEPQLDYVLLGSTNLLTWTVLLITNPPAMPLTLRIPRSTDRGFYRLELQ